MKFRRMISVLTAMVISTAALGSMTASSSVSDRNRLYYEFSYETEQVTSTYTLLHNPVDSTSARTVTLPDDRVLYENSGIVYLSFKFTDSEGVSTGYRGTGFIIGDHTIATAGHNVYSSDLSVFSTDMRVKLYDGDGNYIETVDAVEAHTPYQNMLGSGNHDYALITVEEDLSTYEHFNLGVMVDSAQNSTAIPMAVAGFPGSVYNADNEAESTYDLYIDYGSPGTMSDYRIYYNGIDTSGGQSGGPAFVTTTYMLDDDSSTAVTTRTAVGIHTHGTYCTRITSEMIAFFRNNSNISY